MIPSPIYLPIVTVQHDFRNVVADVCDGTLPQDKFWISCYKHGAPAVHASVQVERDQHGPVFQVDNGLDLTKASGSAYKVTCPSLFISNTPYRDPRLSVVRTDNQPQKITTFDIAPNAERIATGHQDGSVWVRSLADASQPVHRKIHLDALSSLRFFPSSQVLLSAAADFSLAVVSATDLTVPRTFKGHIRPVTDAAIISRGRNVLSCAKDGTIRLWDCGSGSQISLMQSQSYSPILKMSVGQLTDEWHTSSGQRPKLSVAPAEVETSDKLVFCASQNGCFDAIDLGAKALVYHSSAPAGIHRSPLTAIAYSPPTHMLATGSTSGLITLYDIRSLGDPLFTCQRNEAGIEDLVFIPPEEGNADEVRIAVATMDGLPFIASVRPEGPQVVEELVGYDCDPCRTVRYVAGGLWFAGDDGVVRKF